MNLFKVRFQFFYAAIFLSFAGLANSSVVIDFEKDQDGTRRIITFHTQKQALLHYETRTQPQAQPYTINLRDCFSLEYDKKAVAEDPELNHVLFFQPDGSLQINPLKIAPLNSVTQLNFIILSTAPITSNVKGFVDYVACLKRYCWSAKKIVEKTPLEIKAFVKRMKSKRKGEDFFLQKDNFINNNYLPTLENLSDASKGELGELLTRNALFSFGYNTLASIYGNNHGLDGIFLSFSGQYLFLTQSKVGNSHPMAHTLIKNELNERHIHERLKLMKAQGSAEVLQSLNVVMAHLRDGPERIYKLGHTLFCCGFADLDVQLLDIQAFPKEGVAIFNAPVDEKIKAVATTLKAFEVDPTRQLCLAMASVSIQDVPIENAFDLMFTAYGLDDKTKASMLEILRKK